MQIQCSVFIISSGFRMLKTLPAERSDIIFLGNTNTDGAEWNE